MNKTAKLLVLVLALAMMLGVFAGCQGTTTADPTEAPVAEATKAPEADGEGDAEGEEPVTEELEEMEISIAVWDVMESFVDGEMDMEDPLTKYLYDRFKIVWKPWDMTSGDYREKTSVWTAANTLPDLFFGDEKSGTNYPNWKASGLIRSIGTNESLAAYPNILSAVNIDTNTPYMIDNEYWFFPRITFYDRAQGSIVGAALITREDWMEKFGYTQEQVEGSEAAFTAMMKDFTLGDPDGNGVDDTYGIVPSGATGLVDRFKSRGFNEDNIWVYDKNGNIYRANMDYDAFQNACYVRSLYTAGYIVPNYPEFKGNDGVDYFCTGFGGVLPRHACAKHYSLTKTNFWDKAENGLDFADSTCILFSPMPDDGSGEAFVASYAHSWSEMYVPSSVDDAKMERIYMWYDFAYSQEAAYLFLFGFEGTDWEYDENGRVKMLTEIGESGQPISASEQYTIAVAFQEAFVWYTDAYMFENPYYVMGEESKKRNEELIATRKPVPIDYNLQALQTDERTAFVTTLTWDWFVTDKSGASDADLYAQLLADWNGAGYEAACDSLEKAFVEAGYEFQEQYYDVDESYTE